MEGLNRFSKKKIFVACSLSMSAMLLGACGGGGGGGGSSDDPTTTVTISGDAAKGIVIGGVVNVHPIVSGSIDESTVLGSGVTNDSGRYENLELTNYDGGPIAVVISAANDSSTSMVCDIAAGCGDGVNFGDTFVLNELELNAVLPEVDDTSPDIAVTPLSSVASELALNNFSMGSETDILEAIANANTSVADRFGLAGDVTQFSVVDVTDPDEVASADQFTLQYNLYNAAIVEAVLGDDNTASIADAVQAFANQYVDNGGVADTEMDGAAGITLEDILGFASDVVDSIETVAMDAGVDVSLNTLQTLIETQEMIAADGSTDPTEGDSSDNGDNSDLEIVQDTVGDLRDLVNGVDLTDTEVFIDRLELAEAVAGDDAIYALEALSVAAEAIGRAVEFVELVDEQAVEFADGNINVVISEGVYTVEDMIPVETSSGMTVDVDVELIATDAGSTITEMVSEEVADDGSSVNVVTVEETNADVDFSVTGSATITDRIEVEVESGDIAIVLVATDTDNGLISSEQDGMDVFGDEFISELEATDVALDLNVIISELTADNPVSFDGNLTFVADEIASEETDFFGSGLFGETGSALINEFEESLTAGEVTFGLSGEFTDQAGESLTASLQISADARGVEFNCVETETTSVTTGEFMVMEECFDETADNFVEISFGLGFSLDIDGIDNDVAVIVSGERTDIEAADVTASVSYLENQFVVSYSEPTEEDALRSVMIQNQDGVTITLSETADPETDIAGSISLDGTVFAIIEEQDNGLVLINYTDGTFESL